ncbi:hypothetical protein COB64_01210 [Candidatus Wolfebacteria bacterium]|nr:MAG: hypothetical protein COB64_01210 [Candidatus Wolfebacteria bacterium]
MKKILFFIILISFTSLNFKVLFAQDNVKIIDAKENGYENTILSCGEVDSINILLDPSYTHAYIMYYRLNGIGGFHLYRIFWGDEECSFPTNGDINISVGKFSLILLMTIVFLFDLIMFGLGYFGSYNIRSYAQTINFMMLVAPWVLLLSMHSGFFLPLVINLIYFFSWLIVFYIRKRFT